MSALTTEAANGGFCKLSVYCSCQKAQNRQEGLMEAK